MKFLAKTGTFLANHPATNQAQTVLGQYPEQTKKSIQLSEISFTPNLYSCCNFIP
ncbi:MAG: hypothetical protein MRY83_08840 [Flavobacteriales bacterium]|nr:hypothetical protein [Flavobacteriales bacterium]